MVYLYFEVAEKPILIVADGMQKNLNYELWPKMENEAGDAIRVHACGCIAKMRGAVNNRMHATRWDERIIRQSNAALHTSLALSLALSDRPVFFSFRAASGYRERRSEKRGGALQRRILRRMQRTYLICIVCHTTAKNTAIALYIFSPIIYF